VSEWGAWGVHVDASRFQNQKQARLSNPKWRWAITVACTRRHIYKPWPCGEFQAAREPTRSVRRTDPPRATMSVRMDLGVVAAVGVSDRKKCTQRTCRCDLHSPQAKAPRLVPNRAHKTTLHHALSRQTCHADARGRAKNECNTYCMDIAGAMCEKN
jgi:hypothetical protein